VGRIQRRQRCEHGWEILPGCAYFDAYADTNSHSHPHADTYANSKPNTYAYADAMHGKMYPHAKAASDAGAASNIVILSGRLDPNDSKPKHLYYNL
jgi:hypothetical protein